MSYGLFLANFVILFNQAIEVAPGELPTTPNVEKIEEIRGSLGRRWFEVTKDGRTATYECQVSKFNSALTGNSANVEL